MYSSSVIAGESVRSVDGGVVCVVGGTAVVVVVVATGGAGVKGARETFVVRVVVVEAARSSSSDPHPVNASVIAMAATGKARTVGFPSFDPIPRPGRTFLPEITDTYAANGSNRSIASALRMSATST